MTGVTMHLMVAAAGDHAEKMDTAAAAFRWHQYWSTFHHQFQDMDLIVLCIISINVL